MPSLKRLSPSSSTAKRSSTPSWRKTARTAIGVSGRNHGTEQQGNSPRNSRRCIDDAAADNGGRYCAEQREHQDTLSSGPQQIQIEDEGRLQTAVGAERGGGSHRC